MNLAALRAEFPALQERPYGKPLAYLDNAATTQKPNVVLAATARAYREECGNVHRGVHLFSERATASFEKARGSIARFISAKSPSEVVFTKGTTESVNLLAQTFGKRLKPGQEILISGMEHHSNIVPWQLLAEERGLQLKVIPITDRGDLDLEAFERLIGPQTGILSVVWISNALGTVNPVQHLISVAQKHGVPVMLDAAQAVAHVPIDVEKLGCDFLVASAHKAYGPTGVGFLWGKKALLESMPPYQGGGDMIATVSFEKTTYREPPARFEAGTPNIAGVIGFGAALDWLHTQDLVEARKHEARLTEACAARLAELSGIRLVGTPKERAGAVSFVMEGVHPHDIGTILDREGVAVRTGHHCTQPLMQRFSVPATARASFALYNNEEDLDALIRGLAKVREVMG
ncbi:MAG: cysteine desulfurase [Myxococcota bacterium]